MHCPCVAETSKQRRGSTLTVVPLGVIQELQGDVIGADVFRC